MKKILTLLLVIAMVMSVAIYAVADTGSFDGSPSKRKAPELVEGKNTSPDCIATLTITAYYDRDELPKEAKLAIENAYAMIRGTQDLSSLNAKLKELAEEYGVEPTDLAISDLFDISASGCDGKHDDHGHFDVTIKPESLKNFVCLLHYYNNEWRIVDNAEVTNNGTHIEFDEDEFSPFAIVVSTKAPSVKPPVDVEDPAENNTGVIVAVSIAAIIAILVGAYILIKKFKPELLDKAVKFFKNLKK